MSTALQSRAGSGVGTGADWRDALKEAASGIALLRAAPDVSLAFVFASSWYAGDFDELLRETKRLTGAELVVGCSGQGVIGVDREIEGQPAVSLLVFSLPGADLRAFHLDQQRLVSLSAPDGWYAETGIGADEPKAFILFADPFTLDPEALIDGLSLAYPGVPIVGGLASGDQRIRRTHLFMNDTVYGDGAVVLSLAGPYSVRTVVSQGATPIGEAWTITSARNHIIETIAQRPAYDVLVDTVRSLPADTQRRAQANLLVGLAMDEYRDEFRRGDFLIRNLMGVDPNGGAIAVGAEPHVGQTVQFQFRDAEGADEELRHLLERTKREMPGREPLGALLCSCNGRGVGMFQVPDHDARAVSEELGVPVAGFFCNGEIGAVGSRTFLHGFTASIALIVPDGASDQS